MDPQTAAQINDPQTGRIEFRPAAAPEQPAPVNKEPAGWWRLAGLKGPPEAVCRAIDASDAPLSWKQAIKDEIMTIVDQNPAFNFIWLDAHFTIQSGKASLNLTIEPDSQLS